MGDDSRAKSGMRVIRVLEFFRQRQAPARAVEIGRMLDLAPSTTSDLLKMLVEEGYLEFDRKAKSYFIAMRAGLFGGWAASVFPNLARLNELAQSLHEESRETVVIATQHESQIRFLSVFAA